MIVDYYDDTNNLKLLFDIFTCLIVLFKRVWIQLETRNLDTVKSILEQMHCRIWFNKNPETTSDGFWAPVSHISSAVRLTLVTEQRTL